RRAESPEPGGIHRRAERPAAGLCALRERCRPDPEHRRRRRRDGGRGGDHERHLRGVLNERDERRQREMTVFLSWAGACPGLTWLVARGASALKAALGLRKD